MQMLLAPVFLTVVNKVCRPGQVEKLTGLPPLRQTLQAVVRLLLYGTSGKGSL